MMSGWPFKTIKQTSTWPMQPFVVKFAAAVLSAPEPDRPAFARKMIERCVRMGARLAVEFGMGAEEFVNIAGEQIANETGAAAAPAPMFGGGDGTPEA